MKTCQDIKSAAYIDAIINYAEPLLGIRFTKVKKDRYSAPCSFHADTQDSFMVYVTKKDEVRLHCFGACKGDWDIYDMIMLRKKYRMRKAQQVWAEHLGVKVLKFDSGRGPCISGSDETPTPHDTAGFAEPKKLDDNMVTVLNDAANFYNDLLMSNQDRFKHIWDYLARRGVDKNTISAFNIGYVPPYSDEQHQGRALIAGFVPRFNKDFEAFLALSDGGLVRFLNDGAVKEYGYYSRQINFKRKDPFSRNYGDYLAGMIVFPICDANACPTGFIGRLPDDGGVRWLKNRTREVPLSARGWLYGIENAERYIRQCRTIILVEGVFDYFVFYNLLRDQDKPVVVSTLGSYLTPEAANILLDLDIEHFIVALDWDGGGRNSIERVAVKSGEWVYYLGGIAKGQDPYAMLSPVVGAINGFSLKQMNTDTQCICSGQEVI